MQAKVPPATCFPHNKKCQTDSAALGHTSTETFFWGFLCQREKKEAVFFMQLKAPALCVSYEMSNIVQQCQMSSRVVAVVGFWLFCGTRFPSV